MTEEKDIIETGYEALMERLKALRAEKEGLSKKLVGKEALLLEKMVELTVPVLPTIGITMMERTKQDGKGEMYDTLFFNQKMIILGKSDPIPYRPDDMTKLVSKQYCVLGESGALYELMYTTTEHLTDSYLQEMTFDDAFALYGYDLLIMLYKALKEYRDDQEMLVTSLGTTVLFMREENKEE